MIIADLFDKLNGKLSDADKAYIEGAFELLQKRLLHGPFDALNKASKEGSRATLVQAVRELFDLGE